MFTFNRFSCGLCDLALCGQFSRKDAKSQSIKIALEHILI